MSNHRLAFGTRIDFANPAEFDFNLKEFKYHAANISRYNGANKIRLLHHLALCTRLMQHKYPSLVEQAAYAGLHDLHEVITGDMCSALKVHFPKFKDLETIVSTTLHDKLKIPLSNRNEKLIKEIDNISLYLEGYIAEFKFLLYDLELYPEFQTIRDSLDISYFDLATSILCVDCDNAFGVDYLWSIIMRSITDAKMKSTGVR